MAAASTAAYRKSKTIRRASKIDDFFLTPKIPVGDRGDDSVLILDEKLRKLLNGVHFSSRLCDVDNIFHEK
jgi:hypothetical protein